MGCGLLGRLSDRGRKPQKGKWLNAMAIARIEDCLVRYHYNVIVQEAAFKEALETLQAIAEDPECHARANYSAASGLQRIKTELTKLI